MYLYIFCKGHQTPCLVKALPAFETPSHSACLQCAMAITLLLHLPDIRDKLLVGPVAIGQGVMILN